MSSARHDTDEQVLRAPLSGQYEPAFRSSTAAKDGLLLGRIHRMGRAEPITVPAGVEGLVLPPSGPRRFAVGYNDLLATVEPIQSVGELLAEQSVQDQALGPCVQAPIDGIVYLRPTPNAPPFVREGQIVQPGDTVALIEVMKTFHPVRCEEDGPARIEKILVEDGSEVHAAAAVVLLDPLN